MAVNLAAASAKAGLKPLLVGFDVRGNSTDYVMGEPSEPLLGVEDFFKTNYCCVQENQSRL